jgi:hypothetical protein
MTAPDVSRLSDWARLAYDDLVTAATTVGSAAMIDDLTVAYLELEGPEQQCWPARKYWREMAIHMGKSRRQGLALARLWPEYVRFRQGRRSPGCTDVRRILLAGGRPHGLDCMHAARCEHCRMFSLFLGWRA